MCTIAISGIMLSNHLNDDDIQREIKNLFERSLLMCWLVDFIAVQLIEIDFI